MNWISNILSGRSRVSEDEHFELMLRKAYDHYRSGELAPAEAFCMKVLHKRPADPDALFLLGTIALDSGRNDAIARISAAVAANPADANFHFKLGCALQAEGRADEAMAAYRAALQIDSSYAKAYNNLGLLLEAGESLESALDCYQKALDCSPDLPQAHHNKGNVLRKQGRLEEAATCYQQALSLQPDRAEWHENLGNVLRQLLRIDEAVACYEKATSLDPEHADAHCGIGDVHFAKSDHDKALEHYGKALAAAPDSVRALYGLAISYYEQRMLEHAEACARKALALDPKHAEAYAILGDVLLSQGRSNEALAAYLQVTEIDPDFGKVYNNIGTIYEEQGRLNEALESYSHLLKLAPEQAAPYVNIGNILQNKGRLTESEESYRKALEMMPDRAVAHSNLLLVMNYTYGDNAEIMFMEHLRWAERQANQGTETVEFDNERTVDARLRIGYVSPDFRRHSVAYFIEPVIARHDRRRFEVYCYSDVPRADAVTERLRELADHWNNISRLSDYEVAELIREDRIDILVDLAGHTGNNRLPLFARRAAPVQVSYLGYPNTTGLSTMDYRITDCHADPEGMTERYYTEKLVRLPHGFLCFRPPAESPDVGEPPCLSRSFVTFASFNHFPKTSAETIALWARILRAVPGSRLLLKALGLGSADVQQEVVKKFQAHGITNDRIEVRGMVASSFEHLRMYNEADVALDVFPYNGTTTTCEALWMGVPVITLAGKAHVSRVGASILAQVGIADLIADSPEDYADKAINLASDAARLKGLRAGLRQKLRASSLCDAEGFIRELELAYGEMWQRWCDNR